MKIFDPARARMGLPPFYADRLAPGITMADIRLIAIGIIQAPSRSTVAVSILFTMDALLRTLVACVAFVVSVLALPPFLEAIARRLERRFPFLAAPVYYPCTFWWQPDCPLWVVGWLLEFNLRRAAACSPGSLLAVCKADGSGSPSS